MKKVIITGGAGFIGTSLVKALLDNDIEKILIIDDLSTGNKNNLVGLDKIEFIESRIEDVNNLDELVSGYDFCFHLAAGVGVQYIMENVSKALLTNIEATHIIIQACKVCLLYTSPSPRDRG